MVSINEMDEDSNIPVTFSVSDINESLETSSPVPPTDTAECSSSQARLYLLDGTYFKSLLEESTGNKITALCMKCPRDVLTKIKGYHNCTSNFLSHLKQKHWQECIEEYKRYVPGAQRASSLVWTSVERFYSHPALIAELNQLTRNFHAEDESGRLGERGFNQSRSIRRAIFSRARDAERRRPDFRRRFREKIKVELGAKDGDGRFLANYMLDEIDIRYERRGLALRGELAKHVPMFPHVTQRSVTSAARVSQLLFGSLYRWTLKHGGSGNWIKYEPVYRKISIFAYFGR
ncbi:hypothetical protein LAZ67_16002219 [Cordylochernes scorpioides]|uniref:Uncharacterized protein n=1 Tax=Cordylochernes scorpioides TaxID=51811 RepID=A0ABY6LEF2_9ARAC|nr:hypothetical protein LAZ67_16002219 [Cordylochernes scorpioides]